MQFNFELLKEENILNLMIKNQQIIRVDTNRTYVPFPRLFEKAHLITEIKKSLSSPHLVR